MAKVDPRITREEQARTEVGQTQVSPALAAFLVFAFLGLILAVPLVDQWHHRANPTGLLPKPQEAAKAFSEKGLWDGFFALNAQVLRNITTFETALKQSSVVAEAIMPSMHRLLIGEMRAGNENAYCGRDGWLFFRPGVEYLTGQGFLEPSVMAKRARRGDETHEAPQPDPIQAIVQFRDQLAERGVTLVVMPAPDKAALYPEELSARYDGESIVHNPSYAEFVRRLAEEKVLLCDVAPALLDLKNAGTPIYHATDTHWTPEGMQAAAQALAECLRSQTPLPPCAPAAYSRKTSTLENYGDITVMLKLPEGQTYYPKEKAVVSAVHTADDTAWQPDPKADILFLGDSFANIYSLGGMGWGESAGLTEQVSAILERPMDALRINDNGAYATRRELSRQLARGEDRLAGKKVVVWEFAARELAVGDWRLDLPLILGTATQAQDGSGREPGTALHVRAKFKNKSPVPTLEDLAPYTENLTVLEYEVAQVLQGKYPSKTLYVAHWGVLEGAHVPWTQSVQPGAEVELWLEPLADQPKLASVNLSDTVMTDFSLPLFFDAGGLALGQTTPPPGATHGPDDGQAEGLGPRGLPDVSAGESTPPAKDPETTAYNERVRKQNIQTQMDAVRRQVDAVGGWDAWHEALQAFRTDLSARIDHEHALLIGEDGWVDNKLLAEFLLMPTEPEELKAWQAAYAKENPGKFIPNFSSAIESISSVAGTLRAHGIELIFVPIPQKEELYPEFFAKNAPENTPISPQRYWVMKQLLDRGVLTVDLYPALKELKKTAPDTLYPKQDIHWKDAAVLASAQAIAELIKPYRAADESLKTTLASTPTTAKIPSCLAKTPLAPQAVEETDSVHSVVLEDGRLYDYKAFADAGTLAIGDSFMVGGKPGASFAAHLAHALQRPVLGDYKQGGGQNTPKALLEMGPDQIEKRRFVIWYATSGMLARYWPKVDISSLFEGEDESVHTPEIPGTDTTPPGGTPPAQPPGATSMAAPVPLELTPMGISELERLHAMRDKLGGWDAWRESLRPFQKLLQARMGEQQRINGKADVFVGADQFLFSVNRLKYLLTQDDTRAMDAAVNCLTQLSRDLAARGIRTLVVPVPSNEEVYPDKIVSGVPDCPVSPLRTEFVARLLENQIETLDLMPAFEEARKQEGPPLCRENDPHWDTRGIQIAAQSIAGRLRAWGCGGAGTYMFKKEIRKNQGGALLKGLSESDTLAYVNPDVAIEQVFDVGGIPYSAPEHAAVAVLGDSYVDMYSKWNAGIAAHLAAALGAPVSEQSVGGGGPGLAQMLARKSPDFFEGRQAFVLCFVARYLEARNAKDWRPAPLPATLAPEGEAASETSTVAPGNAQAADEDAASQRKTDISEQLKAIHAASASHGGWETWWTSLQPFHEAVAKLPNAPYVTEVEKELFLTQDGYLFSREWDCGYLLCPNLVTPKTAGDRPAQWAPPIDVMADLHAQLQERGIDLIVLPIPPRAEVEPDKLVPGTPSAKEVAPQRLQFLEALLERGIEAIDPLPAYEEALRQGQALSLKKDTHYTNLGAQLTASVLAQRLRRYDFAQHPKNPQSYVTDEVDCLLTISVAKYASKEFAAKLGEGEATRAMRVRTAEGASFKPDPESPVLLIGDSYTYVYDNVNASLAAQLSKELGFPVAHIGMGAGGPAVPRRLAQLGTDGLVKHRVVVWAFVARYLSDNTANYNQWEKIRLP